MATLDETLQSVLAATKTAKDGETVLLPFSLVSNQSNLVVGYTHGSFVCRRLAGPLARVSMKSKTTYWFSDRLYRVGEAPAGGFDTRPSAPFSASATDEITLTLGAPRLEIDRPRGWQLEITLHSWQDALVSVPLTDAPAGTAMGEGPGIGPVASALYVLALGDVGIDRPPIIR